MVPCFCFEVGGGSGEFRVSCVWGFDGPGTRVGVNFANCSIIISNPVFTSALRPATVEGSYRRGWTLACSSSTCFSKDDIFFSKFFFTASISARRMATIGSGLGGEIGKVGGIGCGLCI